MKIKWLLYLTFSSAVCLAEEIPVSSQFDHRIQTVSYHQDDVARINTKLGYITTIVFGANETIDKVISGFEAGWKIESYKNKLFITPIPVEQQAESDAENDGNSIRKYAPTPLEWNTNLFVSTNKRNYNMLLNIASSKDKPAHMVRFNYPEREASMLKQSFKYGRTPKNYNYFVKADSSSSLIVPDFAYDDGEMTYFGFSPAKQLPSVFLLQNRKEQMINYTVEQQGNFKVLGVHNLGKTFVLRSGNMTAGILNKSFGKYVKPYSSTISQEVERVDLTTHNQ